MLKTIKETLPKPLISLARNLKLKILLAHQYRRDYEKFYKNASLHNGRDELHHVRAHITYFYHAIEKGLSNKNLRLGFGKSALKGLYNSLTTFDTKAYPKDDIRYLTAISVIQEYINQHEQRGYNVDDVKVQFSNYLEPKLDTFGGVNLVQNKNLIDNKNLNFKELALSRVSLREFSSEPIDFELINEAITIAMKTPSVCNRQPWKVHLIDNVELRNKILYFQRGLKGSENENFKLILITTNSQYYLGVNERNQGFIDGGLFSMSLLYSLEYVGLGACALNGALRYKDEQEIRRLLNIGDPEYIIMFIAVGNYPVEAKTPKSKRDSYTETTKIY